MAIRIKPPHSSVRRLNRFPQNTPIRLPAIERTKEVKPIIAIGERMDMNEFMPTKAKEMPTANASILVATASVNTTFIIVAEPFFYHSSSQKSQKAESYPVVIVFYQMAEPAGTEPSNKGHNGLKESEKECHYKKSASADATHDDSACYGYRETIHSKTDCQKPNL